MDITILLENLRKERPLQTIHKIYSFRENKYGFYDVFVDMEGKMFDIKINHIKTTLPYPILEYEKLDEQQKIEWKFNNGIL